MIRLQDAFTLAYTKLRTHKVRTGLSVGIAGILFGLMLGMVFIVQGVFDSVERFGKEGLSDRSLFLVERYNYDISSGYDYVDDPSFIVEVEALHARDVARKQAAAARHQVQYSPATEDPSPIAYNSETRQKTIPEENIEHRHVVAAARARAHQEGIDSTFSIEEYLAPYTSTKILKDYHTAYPSDGSLVYMKDGKEELFSQSDNRPLGMKEYFPSDQGVNSLSLKVMDESLTRPFITNQDFDASKGEIPVVITYLQATKLLGLTPLDKAASTQQKLERLESVRQRVGEITIDYCYRNTASEQLLANALAQKEEIRNTRNQPGYQEPSLVYRVPDNTSCGPVTVEKDSRTDSEKQQEARITAFEKEVGSYAGDPTEQKITLRGVGIVGEVSAEYGSGVTDMVVGLLGSNLGWNVLAVPSDLLAQVPDRSRPAEVFSSQRSNDIQGMTPQEQAYMVEFSDIAEARTFLDRYYNTSYDSQDLGSTSVAEFGSNSLLIDEFKQWFAKIIMWMLLVVGGVAVVIMGSMIGRTVAEGRRESAVFRAIGAKRTDIAAIYSSYAFLLSLRVAAFALTLGLVIAGLVQLLNGQNATVGARLAYAASDTTLEFYLISPFSWYGPLIIGVILLVGMLASIIPITRSARRSPITDMRDDT